MLVGDTWREYMTVCNCCDGLVELLWLRGRGKEFPGRWLAKLDHQRFLNNVHLTTIGDPGRLSGRGMWIGVCCWPISTS
jgi:hypothetical protein